MSITIFHINIVINGEEDEGKESITKSMDHLLIYVSQARQNGVIVIDVTN